MYDILQTLYISLLYEERCLDEIRYVEKIDVSLCLPSYLSVQVQSIYVNTECKIDINLSRSESLLKMSKTHVSTRHNHTKKIFDGQKPTFKEQPK